MTAAAKPGPPSESRKCETFSSQTDICFYHGEPIARCIRALEARVKELEAALREAKRAMDGYAPTGKPSLRGRFDTRAQKMVDAAVAGIRTAEPRQEGK